jgi:hypothetical protein
MEACVLVGGGGGLVGGSGAAPAVGRRSLRRLEGGGVAQFQPTTTPPYSTVWHGVAGQRDEATGPRAGTAPATENRGGPWLSSPRHYGE